MRECNEYEGVVVNGLCDGECVYGAGDTEGSGEVDGDEGATLVGFDGVKVTIIPNG